MKNLSFLVFVLAIAVSANAAVYEVKPGTPLDTIAEVPWATLQPGDTVLIYWKPTPYREKWVICRQGTAEMPITVRGVPNENGQLPVVDGNGAVTPTNLNFWNENRGTIKIGGANVPADTMPKYITIEALEIRGAFQTYQFTRANGQIQNYAQNAAPIYVEKAENLTIRNCIITDGGNGLFIGSPDETPTRNVLIEGNYIYGNGNSGSAFEHNNYTAALGITFQYNRFGPLRTGANGNNLKDRSAGFVARYNWIEGGNRNLDLVDAEDSSVIRNSPEYHKTFVYGNVLIKQNGGNNQITHYGGDSGDEPTYRKGRLYFYNNTIFSERTGNTVVFRLSTNDETCDARNNIFYTTAAGPTLAMLAESGTLALVNNWSKSGWRNSFEGGFDGSVTGGGTMIIGTTPGFVNASTQNFHLAKGSNAIDAGTALHADALPANALLRQYVKHQMGENRPVSGAIDLGAYEYLALSPPPVITTKSLPNAIRMRWYDQQILHTGGTGTITFSISEGNLPPGLLLDAASGRIYGNARLKGSWIFTVQVTDSLGLSSTKEFTVETRLHF